MKEIIGIINHSFFEKRIGKIDGSFFEKIFKTPTHVKDFLKQLLPKDIRKQLDFSTIKTNRIHKVSGEFKEGDADIVLKTLLVIQKMKIDRNDFYLIIEKKSEGEMKILVQTVTV
jgi:hypothetical protein